MNSITRTFVFTNFFLAMVLAPNAFGYVITNVAPELRGDFVLEPAKIEIFADPGHVSTTDMRITNRTEKDILFRVSVEDTKGSDNPENPIELLGSEKGPYSLKDYITPEIETFTLRSGEQITLPVTVSIPADAEAGGLYGSVLFESGSAGDTASSGSRTISRLGALLFVRVNGEVTEIGALEDFRVSGGSPILFTEDLIGFEMLYRNSGSVHVNPYGMITVRNIFGMTVAEIEVPPYYAMPESLRYRKVTWEHGPLFGYYVATLEQNRGYDDIVDTQRVSFAVLPWKESLIVVVGILVLVFGIRWFFRAFEFKRKS